MGAGYNGKVVAVAVDGRKHTAAAFRAALAQVGPDNCLLIIFARPLKTGSFHYRAVTKSIQRRYDALSKQLLVKYSGLGANAKVRFEAVEIEGSHLREAVLRLCHLSAADVLYEATPTRWEWLMDSAGGDSCQLCNPYLRSGGRFSFQHHCQLEFSQAPPCPVFQVTSF